MAAARAIVNTMRVIFKLPFGFDKRKSPTGPPRPSYCTLFGSIIIGALARRPLDLQQSVSQGSERSIMLKPNLRWIAGGPGLTLVALGVIVALLLLFFYFAVTFKYFD
jgi:hypothetical protein